jgi:hypothetical protein
MTPAETSPAFGLAVARLETHDVPGARQSARFKFARQLDHDVEAPGRGGGVEGADEGSLDVPGGVGRGRRRERALCIRLRDDSRRIILVHREAGCITISPFDAIACRNITQSFTLRAFLVAS